MFIRGGAGEFRCMVQMDNGMSDCYGLTIHSIGDSWQSYTTIWEDAVAHAAEVDLSDAVSEKMEQKEMEQIPTDQIPEQHHDRQNRSQLDHYQKHIPELCAYIQCQKLV